jgi:2-oxoglutarate ferredoxin oxidoreductase subunit alpha
MVKKHLEVIDERCKGCGICVTVCKPEALRMNGQKIALDTAKCNACGLCTFSCPDLALVLKKMDDRQREERLVPFPDWREGLVQPQPGLHFMQGATACSEGAIAAGCRFFAGYPITPSTEIAEEMSVRLPQIGGRFIQLEDEIASMGAIAGASLSGIKSMTATSGPGFSLMQENLGAACMREIPVVVVNVMRGGPCTGLPTRPAQGDVMQARWGTHGDHQIIALAPWSVSEMFWLTVRAFNLSEKYRIPVILLPDEIVAHMRERIVLPDYLKEVEVVERMMPADPPEKYKPFDTRYQTAPLPPYGRGYRFHVTGLTHRADGFPTGDPATAAALIDRHERKITDSLADIVQVHEVDTDDAETVVVAYGSTARSAKEAVSVLRRNGKKVGMLRPITLWPFPVARLEQLSDRGCRFIVVEANRGQILGEVERIAGRRHVRSVLQADGNPIMARTIERALSQG